eukprot:SAG22_NODE_153_length_17315_cov_69.981935_4_plen_95_part_00
MTPLMVAANLGHLGPVVALLNRFAMVRRAAVNARNRSGSTALHFSATNGDLPVSEALVAAGADKAARTESGKTARDFAVEVKRDRWEAVAKLLE